MAQHSSGLRPFFVDGYGIAAAGHLVGKRQPRRTRADYADRFGIFLIVDSWQRQIPVDTPVAKESFHSIDGHRAILAISDAKSFTGVWTNAANDRGEWIPLCQ